MGNKTKIDWCDSTWNPVTGCLHGCEYCYAKKIAKRFCSNEHGKSECGIAYPCGSIGDCKFCSELDGYEFVGQGIRWNHDPSAIYPYGFFPTFHPHRMDVPAQMKRPRTIFVCSMADLFGAWMPDKIIEKVFSACKKAKQHRYLFLTKNPARYGELVAAGKLPKERNYWYGITATDHQMAEANFRHVPNGWDGYNIFLSAEPLHGEINTPALNSWPKWVILGAETGNHKGKIIPKKGWVVEIAEQAKQKGIPVFMKESLRGMMGPDFIQEYPWEV